MAKSTRPKRKLITISFFVPDKTTKERIEAAAATEGMLPSVWVRETILREVVRIEKAARR